MNSKTSCSYDNEGEGYTCPPCLENANIMGGINDNPHISPCQYADDSKEKQLREVLRVWKEKVKQIKAENGITMSWNDHQNTWKNCLEGCIYDVEKIFPDEL